MAHRALALSASWNAARFYTAAALFAAACFCRAGELPAPPEEKKTGIGLGPGMVVIGNIPLGKEIDPNLVFEVHNYGGAQRTVFLKAMHPKDSGVDKNTWEKGYEPIPDPKWCRLEKEELDLAPRTMAKVKAFVTIPDKPENYNRKFIIAIVCEGKPPKEKGRAGIMLRLVSRWGVETLSKDDADGAGAGDVALVPSVLRHDAKPGETYEIKMKIRNNSKAARTFNFKRLTDVESEPERHARYYGPGREAVHKTSWLGPMEKVTVGAGEAKEMKFKVAVAADAIPDKVYEELLFLEDDTKHLEFIRIRTPIAKP